MLTTTIFKKHPTFSIVSQAVQLTYVHVLTGLQLQTYVANHAISQRPFKYNDNHILRLAAMTG